MTDGQMTLDGETFEQPPLGLDTGKPFRAAPDIQKLPLVDLYHEVKLHPKNVRRHKIDGIVESLKRYGQQSPIVVQRSTGYVCKGNGTVKAARDVLGWTHLHASIEDFDDDTALRYLLADNKTSDDSENDKAALGALLKDFENGTQGLQGTLFTPDDAEDIWADIGAVTTVLADTDATYVETPEELKARIESRASERAGTLKEVVLVLDAAQYEEFALGVSRLSRAYGTKGTVATVVEAVRRANAQVFG